MTADPLLDPTKLVPEEIAPVQLVGKMTVNRNPTNCCADTEQVAFHTGNLVPGIEPTNDPLTGSAPGVGPSPESHGLGCSTGAVTVMTSSAQSVNMPSNGRTGFLSLHLPQKTPAGAVPGLLRQLVIDALASSGESLARLEIVTSERSQLRATKRWFVEYETGPP